MTWVKVCGLTNEVDVAAAVTAGADAIGFVNVPASPRYIPLERVRDLARDVPIHTILLTIDLAPERSEEVLANAGVDGIQPYGRRAADTARAARDAGYIVLYPQKADRALQSADVAGIPLLDTPSQTALGGTGQTFDWSVVMGLNYRFVLAGGLGPQNVADAVGQVAPWGVDASSGLERSAGIKDKGMVADFITIAKSK
jgi:phosphoribosylanthranilate isomerase